MPEAESTAPAVPVQADRQQFGHVFVYGTLRKGDDNDITALTPSPEFVGMAVIDGVMHHLGGYPGVLLGATGGAHGHAPGKIVGEVYRISAELERKLDEIEALYPEQTDEYFKRQVTVLVDGQSIECIVYEINPAYCLNSPILASGDWVRDRHSPIE